MATVNAVNPVNYVQLSVVCESDYGPTSATLTYAGHTVSVYCNAAQNRYEYSATICVYVKHVSMYKVVTSVDWQTQTQSGSFRPNQGVVVGGQVAPDDFYESAFWLLASPCLGG